jgi:hypothetical protein
MSVFGIMHKTKLANEYDVVAPTDVATSNTLVHGLENAVHITHEYGRDYRRTGPRGDFESYNKKHINEPGFAVLPQNYPKEKSATINYPEQYDPVNNDYNSIALSHINDRLYAIDPASYHHTIFGNPFTGEQITPLTILPHGKSFQNVESKAKDKALAMTKTRLSSEDIALLNAYENGTLDSHLRRTSQTHGPTDYFKERAKRLAIVKASYPYTRDKMFTQEELDSARQLYRETGEATLPMAYLDVENSVAHVVNEPVATEISGHGLMGGKYPTSVIQPKRGKAPEATEISGHGLMTAKYPVSVIHHMRGGASAAQKGVALLLRIHCNKDNANWYPGGNPSDDNIKLNSIVHGGEYPIKQKVRWPEGADLTNQYSEEAEKAIQRTYTRLTGKTTLPVHDEINSEHLYDEILAHKQQILHDQQHQSGSGFRRKRRRKES